MNLNFIVMKRIMTAASAALLMIAASPDSGACTGISLKAQDGSRVVARTVEWAATPMQCGYAVVPRGHVQQSYTPSGENGLKLRHVLSWGHVPGAKTLFRAR